MSERLACKAVGLARSTYRRLPLAQTPLIRTPNCGPGCAPMPRNIRAMGSGVPGRRCATTSAVR